MIPKLSESFGMFRKVSETLILRENGIILLFLSLSFPYQSIIKP